MCVAGQHFLTTMCMVGQHFARLVCTALRKMRGGGGRAVNFVLFWIVEAYFQLSSRIGLSWKLNIFFSDCFAALCQACLTTSSRFRMRLACPAGLWLRGAL